ncbi:channel protein TolC [Pseudohoeflea suaedae]|uniref:Channel protein TolC n=1 Tax=Pseudohoeflea suaedae TaxID=877384 RepID=A0A4R5PI15_9HYPH|nr:TolC family protein [Pseudohoeflea suaedae]TDH34482.1 channel protein TolC [Pseudohoeflea suaedae]
MRILKYNILQVLKSAAPCALVGFNLSLGAITPAGAISLNDAVAVAVEANPEIGQAIENREAIEFELRQARGLFLPTVDLEASAGGRLLDNPSRRSLGIDGDGLSPVDASVVITHKLFDSGARSAELRRQAARVDGASFRVLERSEYIGLQVVREYLEYLLQARIVAETEKNLAFHQRIQSNIADSVANGTLTAADRQQVIERVLASRAQLIEVREELANAKISFLKLVGKPLDSASMPGSISASLPRSVDQALGLARQNNPRIHMANADIDAADALVDAARAKRGPEVLLEGRAIAGNDIDGADGRTSDLQARVVAKWRIFDGGIAAADEQEQIRRVGESRLVLDQVQRELEESVRQSWERRSSQRELAGVLRSQAQENNRLVGSYREQFTIGQRSLLDVLDAQNTRYNVDVLAVTAEYAALFADYRLLAATGELLDTLNVSAPRQGAAYARSEFKVAPTAPTDTYARLPSRQVNELPMDLLAPMKN